MNEQPQFIPYGQFVQLAGLSGHIHHLNRRMAKYPAHFAVINGTVHISQRLALALVGFQLSTAQLDVLQKGGAHV